MPINSGLTAEENIYFKLKNLYESFGYIKYKTSKFEEYSLYLENKDFLKSEYIITFNSPDGKLLALKPDVTLSIVKNTKATKNNSEKLYYKENVYRLNTNSREYKEISQMGLELLGEIDSIKTLEICSLAEKSLSVIDDNYALEFSHIGVIKGLYAFFNIEDFYIAQKLNNCIGAKNIHEIKEICNKENLSLNLYETLKNLIALDGNFETGINELKKYLYNDMIKNALNELEIIYNQYKNNNDLNKIRLDFSIINNLGYYTGLIMRGYIEGIPRVVLSGGRYDKLIKKFRKDISAMGFAIYLDELTYFKKQEKKEDIDTLILYTDNSDYKEVLRKAESIRSLDKIVRVEKNIPLNISYKEVIKC